MHDVEKTNDPPTTGENKCCKSSTWWRLPLLLVAVLTAIVLVNGRGIRREQPAGNAKLSAPPAAAENDQTAALAIRIDETNSVTTNATPWREGMTVRDLLAAATKGDPPELIKFSQQGTGDSAFLTQLAGVANEGAGGRNWMYEVNGKRGDRSFAVYELQPGDQVLWKFVGPQ